MFEKKVLNIVADANTTYKHTEVYVDTNGTPIDLTDYTAKLQARYNYGSDTVLLELTDTSGIELGVDGSMVITISGTQTDELPVRCKYDLLLTDVNNETYKVLMGDITINPTITRLV
jgi:outer membrane lipoprotein-sorting protein